MYKQWLVLAHLENPADFPKASTCLQLSVTNHATAHTLNVVCNYEETRVKMKNLIILISILISNLTFGQDGIAWGFEIKFKIETEGTWRANLLTDYEFLINDRYFDHSGYVQEYKTVKYDSISKEYKIILSYSGVGGKSQVAYVHCPEIYIKACFSKDPYWKVGEYSSFIAVYFENAKGSHQKYDLGTIKLSEFANDYIEVKEENSVLPPYEIIEVQADKKIYKRSKGQYEPRRMNKIVKLEKDYETTSK